MTNFTHYLVTRFNVRINGNGPEFILSDSRGPNWELERTALFEIFCAPTVVGQTNTNFTWLIYCDQNTPEEITQRILAATRGAIKVEIVPVMSFNELLSHLRQLVSHCSSPFVITTRLDNDDGLGINFIHDIQSNFVPEDLVVLNQLGGVNYHAGTKVLTEHRHYINNSFLTLIETTQPTGMVTIMGFNHLHPMENMKVINLAKKYAFWRTLHQQNTAIRGNRGWPILPTIVKDLYTLDFSQVKVSWTGMLLYALRWFPRAVVRKIIYRIRN